MAINSPKNDFVEKHRFLTYADEVDTVYDGSKILDGSVTTDKIADYAVTTDKIDDESITLSKMNTDVLNLLEGNVKGFDTVADMQAATLEVGDICHTNGFHASGDGGAAFYKVTASGTANDMDVLACGGVFANLVITESYVTPEMFGCVKNTDATNGFNRMFQIARNIVIDNDFELSSPISISSNTSVVCNGEITYSFTDSNRKGIINGETVDNVNWQGGKFTGSGALTQYVYNKFACFKFITSNNVVIDSITFEKVPEAYAICLEHCSNSAVKNCFIDKYTYGGVVFLNGCDKCLIRNNKVTGCANTTDSNSYPISLSLADSNGTYDFRYGKNISCIDNYIEDSQNPHWEGIDSHGGENLTICNNTIKNRFTGIAVTNIDSVYAKNVIISGNTCIYDEVYSSNENKANVGILAQANGCVISDNLIIGYGKIGSAPQNKGGISIASSASIATDYVISNNILLDIGYYGILATGCNAVIDGNRIEFDPTDTTRYGVVVNRSTIYCLITNNTFVNEARTGTGDSQATGGTNTNYVKFANNAYKAGFYNHNWYVPQGASSYSGSSWKCGRIGDIVLKSNPSTGNPIGWLCTTSATEADIAQWTALPNL